MAPEVTANPSRVVKPSARTFIFDSVKLAGDYAGVIEDQIGVAGKGYYATVNLARIVNCLIVIRAVNSVAIDDRTALFDVEYIPELQQVLSTCCLPTCDNNII